MLKILCTIPDVRFDAMQGDKKDTCSRHVLILLDSLLIGAGPGDILLTVPGDKHVRINRPISSRLIQLLCLAKIAIRS
jgi:hypothetical protein